MDILPVLNNQKLEVYTKTINDRAISWTIFSDPFSTKVWLLILLVAMLISFILTFIEKIFNLTKEFFLVSYLKNLWISLTANMGGKPNCVYKNTTHQIVLFTCLSVGFIVWIAFRASMTSELSVVQQKLPFNDLKSLHETSYK